MCRGRYQPLLLIYQTSDTNPLDTSSAIKKSFKIEDFLHSFKNVQSAMVPSCEFDSVLCSALNAVFNLVFNAELNTVSNLVLIPVWNLLLNPV